jgi:predicted DNA-binding transcriptional regulator YafY
MRQDFRHFRTDRVEEAIPLEERYPDRLASLRARWRKTLKRPPQPVGAKPLAENSAAR